MIDRTTYIFDLGLDPGERMNDADKKKLGPALNMINSIEGQLENVIKRGPAAIKAWEDTAKSTSNEDLKKKLKGQIVPQCAELIKKAKSALKDLNTLYKEGSEAKKLAAYPTGKDFRTKTAKYMAHTKTFDENSAKFVLLVTTALGSPALYPAMGDVGVKVTMDSIGNFSTYLTALKVELAKL
jgi:hypothetical protein